MDFRQSIKLRLLNSSDFRHIFLQNVSEIRTLCSNLIIILNLHFHLDFAVEDQSYLLLDVCEIAKKNFEVKFSFKVPNLVLQVLQRRGRKLERACQNQVHNLWLSQGARGCLCPPWNSKVPLLAKHARKFIYYSERPKSELSWYSDSSLAIRF